MLNTMINGDFKSLFYFLISYATDIVVFMFEVETTY